MDEKTAFIMMLTVMTVIMVFLNFLVWFRFSKLETRIKKAQTYSEKSNLPFTGFYASLLKSGAYKWFVRFILLGMLMISGVPLLIMVSILLFQ